MDENFSSDPTVISSNEASNCKKAPSLIALKEILFKSGEQTASNVHPSQS